MANTPADLDNAFLREVDEEYRRSQMAGLWKRFGWAVITIVLLALAALAGYLFWQDRQAKAAGAAGAALTRAVEQLEVGEGARARPVLEAMTRDGPGAYSGLARMVLANDALAGGDKAKAGDSFKLAQSVIDSVADKGVFHKNKAARLKSRLAAKVKALALAA